MRIILLVTMLFGQMTFAMSQKDCDSACSPGQGKLNDTGTVCDCGKGRIIRKDKPASMSLYSAPGVDYQDNKIKKIVPGAAK